MNTKNTEKSEVALREEAVMDFWREHDVFAKSIETPAGQEPVGDFVFYDGPPFATGLPHYGHILAGTIKDAIPRFWTMNGYRVRRKWGWDCHGLPLENLIEKKLGLATKRDIEEYGVKNFNEAARDAVLEYADDWAEIVPRMGRWADMENDYKTMDPSYTESVWWVFKSLHDKGLVYEGFKSMHLCPRCGTTLSNFEVNQGYQDIKDIAVTVKLPLKDDPDTSLLVWTTTPWTLPGNMAAAVHEEYDYVKVKVTTEEGTDQVILAKGRLEQLGTDEYEIIAEMKGADLVGQSYEPPFPYNTDRDIEGKENAWKIYHADYVELGDEGTGAVHLAPAYGDDDMKLAQEHGVPIVHHVDPEGHFMSHVSDFAGQLVKPKDDEESGVMHLDADIEIVKALKERGGLYKKENITHSYPHCWRCDTPLLNYATTSWFVEVTKIKDDLVAENNKVHWVPDHVGKNRFGKWLDGARDWAISRQRYWGAPLPIWRNPETKDIKVFGGIEDLKEYVPKRGNTFIAMRHGEAQSNLDRLICTDINTSDPLTETGKQQVATASKELKEAGIDLIVTSPFARTKETAAIVQAELGLADEQVIEDERIQELQVGANLQGKPWQAFYDHYGSFIDQFTTSHEHIVENRGDLVRRVGEFLYDLNEKYENKTILVVGHKSSLFSLSAAAQGVTIADMEDFQGTFWPENAETKEVAFTPLPHNDNYELDFHRPYIDDIELFDGETKLERVSDVFDCWFESGSMPYGQHHYPFENSEAFEKEHFPAQFIAEGLDQTRGWFYSLIVLGTALFGKSPYENVIVNGLVLAEDGKKMSKKLQNYPDPMELADRVGVDAIRYYMLSAPIMRAEDLNFSEKEVLELQRKNIGRLHNVLAMYEQFADKTANYTEPEKEIDNILDIWIADRMNQLISESTAGYKNYELDKANRPITDFIDDLSVWYLRRSRDRLKGEGDDKESASAVLRHMLKLLSQVMAPAMPFYSEYLWRAVRTDHDAESVHLSAWPKYTEAEHKVTQEMSTTREIVTKALEARAKAGIKVRQPLASIRVKHAPLDEAYVALITDEVNVKEVTFEGGDQKTVELDTEITPELQAEGDARDFMRAVQDLRKQAGLNADDAIELTVQASKDGEAIIEQFKEEISKTIGANTIIYDSVNGEDITAGTHSFTVSLTKI